jgi:hypothetical protein
MDTNTSPETSPPSPAFNQRNRTPLVLAALGVLAVAAAIWWFGVRDTNSPVYAVEDLYGSWLTSPGSTMTYYQDGSWDAVYPPWGPSPFDFGTYTFDGKTLTMFSTDGRVCRTGQTGIYEAEFVDEDSLSVIVVEDPCLDRREIANADMLRQNP